MQSNRVLTLARVSYILGLATVFWDRFLVIDFSEFHVKFAYFCLLLSFVVFLFGGDGSIRSRLNSLVRPLIRSPWVFMLAFSIVSLALTIHSPQVKKSAGYTAWCFFNLGAFACTGIALFAAGREDDERWRNRLVAGWSAGVVLVAIVGIIDFTAYFFGAKEGLIGSFQPHVLGFTGGGLPRPQAFSYEPSYLALAICLPFPVLLLRVLLAESQSASMACAQKRFRATLIISSLLVLTIAQVLVFSRTGIALFALEALFVFAYLFRIVCGAGFLGCASSGQAGKPAPLQLTCAAAALLLVAVISFFLIPREQRQAIHQKFIVSVFNKTDASAKGRLHAFTGGIELARNNPWGSGPGTSMWRWQDYYEQPDSRQRHPQQATSMMSLWPEIVIEQGLPGLAFFLTFLIALIWQLARQTDTTSRGLLISLILIAGLDFFFLPTVTRADLWSLFALCGIFAAVKPVRAVLGPQNHELP